uniref:Uncharacterized protein n=1 Tax=Opuntia streptacantha TaxID=393608 RepID=A0A7C8ZYD5_OPUST
MSKPSNHHHPTHHHPPRQHRPPPRQHPPPPRHHPQPPPPPPPRPHTQQQQTQHHHHQQQQQQELPVWYPHPPPHRPPKPLKPKRTTLASCIVATIFIVFLLIILFIIYFSLFKPKDPQISVTAIQLPTFSLSSNTTTAVSFTFSLYAAVRNPNRGQFSHFDSSLQLLYAGNQIGFMFIPAGEIAAGRTKYMAATFSVQAFPISNSPAANFPAMLGPPGVNRVSPTMEIEARMEMVGRVRVLWFFNHNVKDVADCRVAVAINDGFVLGFHC